MLDLSWGILIGIVVALSWGFEMCAGSTAEGTVAGKQAGCAGAACVDSSPGSRHRLESPHRGRPTTLAGWDLGEPTADLC